MARLTLPSLPYEILTALYESSDLDDQDLKSLRFVGDRTLCDVAGVLLFSKIMVNFRKGQEQSAPQTTAAKCALRRRIRASYDHIPRTLRRLTVWVPLDEASGTGFESFCVKIFQHCTHIQTLTIKSSGGGPEGRWSRDNLKYIFNVSVFYPVSIGRYEAIVTCDDLKPLNSIVRLDSLKVTEFQCSTHQYQALVKVIQKNLKLQELDSSGAKVTRWRSKYTDSLGDLITEITNITTLRIDGAHMPRCHKTLKHLPLLKTLEVFAVDWANYEEATHFAFVQREMWHAFSSSRTRLKNILAPALSRELLEYLAANGSELESLAFDCSQVIIDRWLCSFNVLTGTYILPDGGVPQELTEIARLFRENVRQTVGGSLKYLSLPLNAHFTNWTAHGSTFHINMFQSHLVYDQRVGAKSSDAYDEYGDFGQLMLLIIGFPNLTTANIDCWYDLGISDRRALHNNFLKWVRGRERVIRRPDHRDEDSEAKPDGQLWTRNISFSITWRYYSTDFYGVRQRRFEVSRFILKVNDDTGGWLLRPP